MRIKISVVIPTYKRPELLIRCLTALGNQSLCPKDFEIIVVSDGPDTRTEHALKKWAHKKKLNLNYLHTLKKEGPAGARNMGWLNARSELIAFTDDDCIPDRDWLKVFAENFSKPSLIAFTGKTIVPLARINSDFANNTAGLEKAEFITANCACAKKALLLAGGFDERFKLAWREDSDLQFRLLLKNIPITSLDSAIVFHPVRQAPWGISIKEQKKGIYDALLFKKHPGLYRQKIQTQPLWNYYGTITLWLLLMVSLYKDLPVLKWGTTVLLILSIAVFIYKRLRHTDKSPNHVTEMLVTSIIIPFFSVFWRVYGAVKFRVFFI